MSLTGLHLLLTNTCNYECDHCFVWGSPRRRGTMTLSMIRRIYEEGKKLGTVESIYIEGGEPFLYYPILVRAAHLAHEMDYRVGIVSNRYWATAEEDALEWLQPLAGVVDCLSVSADGFHGDEPAEEQARIALDAAKKLGIPANPIACARPESKEADPERQKGEPVEGGTIAFKGRAAEMLAGDVPTHPWERFDECPHELLDDPGRVHVDPAGNMHVCQGLSMGNLLRLSLVDIVARFQPAGDPVFGPLMEGGPAALVERHGLPHRAEYADACHLCYEARTALRERFPDVLCPGGMYGEER